MAKKPRKLSERTKAAIGLATVLAIAATLLFWRLGGRALWQDEGETAVLARSVLVHGVPTARTGANLVFQDVVAYDEKYRWTFHPWGQFYVAAASMALFGPTTWAARAPFAACGLLTVALLYLFVWRHWRCAATAACAALLLTGSATFIIHCRQCRYYGLSAFVCLLVVVVYFECLLRRRTWWWILGAAALAAQFYVDFGTLIVILPGLALGLWINKVPRRQLLAALLAALGAAIICIPGLLLHWDQLTAKSAVKSVFFQNLAAHLAYLDGWFIPLIAILASCAVLGARLMRCGPLGSKDRIAISCGVMVAMGFLMMAWAAPFPHIRYLMPFMSLSKLLLALVLMGLFRLAKRSAGRIVAAAVIAACAATTMFTNIASLPLQLVLQIPNHKTPDFRTSRKPYLRSELSGLLYELTHDFVCPNTVAANVIQDLVSDGDLLLINYGELPIMYHHPRLVIRRDAGDLPAGREPDIVLVRTPFDVPFEPYVDELIGSKRLIPIKVSIPDMVYGNIPEPRDHRFTTPEQRQDFWVFVHRRRRERLAELPNRMSELTGRWSEKSR